ncbi:hypothetical protein [Kineococcus radiotolerans]|uniref:Uncharacterized protein n=1 Tax=Kineococcus radiotolerans (strain ATCC BAA-149 / DSM 14245 / SRS30216) TaxID=266940 RepID=A6W8H6_KINRD|nr:hypothetical protein [Kineococcus radiotolerans]ABS03115.1 hypothetical protein Krad_1629 [Kineococcus radiotolerans SRS30216 = ATCC BAA-149]
MIDPVGPVESLAGDRWRDAWGAALADVEVDVTTAEELLARLHAGGEDVPEELLTPQDWIAPSLQGAIPMEFSDRARRLLQRHLEVSERLAEALVQVRAQRRALGKMERAERRPVFFDKPL